ncbi:MAG: glycosyltransferase family 39 protein [Bacteroidales bacterium]|nr:glycosyltransferase family 39 protein [Bacteroidales bacterium]
MAFVFIIVLSLIIHNKYINEFPVYIHSWAQCDWYAMSSGFTDNGLDFFHPQTSIYNKQFPDWWASSSNSTITATDFPLHEYIIAIGMSIFGTTSPWIFRVWTLLISMAGMFFLYKLAYLLTKDFFKSLLTVGLALTAPVFAYYFCGFLPGIPSFAFSVAGLWAYFEYVYQKKSPYFHISVILLGIALLMRSTYAIPLIAVLCYEFLRICLKESSWGNKLLSVIAVGAVYLAWHLWNGHLRAKYGSLFLNELMPPQSLDNAKDIWLNVQERWKFQYFSKFQHVFVAIIAVLSVVTSVYQRLKHKAQAENHQSLSPWWFVVIYLFGCGLFVFAMMQQFSDHDYYFIDSLFLPILLIFILLIGTLPTSEKLGFCVAEMIVAISVIVLMTYQVRDILTERRYPNDRALQCAQHYQNSAKFLDDAHVDRKDKILALFAYPQNAPFIQMERKGYILMWYKPEIVQNVLASPFDYIVIENEMAAAEWNEHADMISHLRPIAHNEFLTLCCWSDSVCCHSFEEFEINP